jgi:repressor LexA
MGRKGTRGSLSDRQSDAFTFIEKCIKGGCPPTLREIMDKCDIKSTNGAKYTLKILEQKGYVDVIPNTSRGIRLRKR